MLFANVSSTMMVTRANQAHSSPPGRVYKVRRFLTTNKHYKNNVLMYSSLQMLADYTELTGF